MTEQTLRKNWRLGTPIKAGVVSLLPIEQTTLFCKSLHNIAFLSVTWQPCAIIVLSGANTEVLSIGNEDVSLADLRAGIAELDAALSRLVNQK